MKYLILIPAWTWLLISAVWFTAGEYLSKRWGMQPSLRFAVLVVAVYAVGTFAWLPALLHKNQLALMGTLWLVLATVATVGVGVLVFGEQLSVLQWVGVGLALVALALLGS